MLKKRQGYINCILNNGIGHQLFQFFNAQTISKTYKLPLVLYQTDNVYDFFKNENKEKVTNYQVFSKIKINNKEKLNLKSTFFGKPVLQSQFLKRHYVYNLLGYFESFKNFWNNSEYLVSLLNINDDLLIKTKEILSNEKKTIGIYFKHQNYNLKPNTEFILEYDYYWKILENYNKDDYRLMIFSDEFIKSKNMIDKLGFEIINVHDFGLNEEELFFLYFNCPIKISSNSLFSLMGCLLPEMLKKSGFETDQLCYFPNTWSGINGEFLNVKDLIPDLPNFKIIQTKKCAVIFYHKNILKIYENYWIEKCRDSILNQNNIVFDCFELNYGNTDYTIFSKENQSKFFKKDLKTHTEAMIFLLNYCFENGYDLVYNTNLDDYFDYNRFYYQYIDIISNKALLNSALWTQIEQDQKNPGCDRLFNMRNNTFFYTQGKLKWLQNDFKNPHFLEEIPYELIKIELNNHHNVICHPGVCFTKEFWNSFDKFGNKLRYRNDKPFEDLSLWMRAVQNNIKISIVNKHLINYRRHSKSICASVSKTKDNAIGPNLNEKNLGFIVKSENLPKELDFKHFYVIFIDNSSQIIEIEEKLKDNRYILIKRIEGISDEKMMEEYRETIEMNCDEISYISD